MSEEKVELPAEIIQRVLSETIKVTRGGKTETVTVWEAVCFVLAKGYVEGDPTAMRLVARLARRWKWFERPRSERGGVIVLDE